jgi:hypothetical protein
MAPLANSIPFKPRPANRFSAGVIAITDGIVHDIPTDRSRLSFTAPFHALVTGRPNEFDRRVELVEAPRFGIVGKDVTVTVRVENQGAPQGPVRMTIRQNGQVLGTRNVMAGVPARLPLRIDRAGMNLFEISVETAPGELTALNNLLALPIDGVRDKLRVLLVSGEPHAGERTWRNLLKADPNVDLVHFTILRPPEKQDGTPTNELSLIAFPTRELFVTKISEFATVPLLRKDFTIHETQIHEAVIAGADAILLIVAALDDELLRRLYDEAKSFQLDVLVEVHDLAEMERAIDLGADLIGINNRNLKTFVVDMATTERLAEEVPDDVILVSESGIKTHDDALRALQAGANAILVGETLMRADDPSRAVEAFMELSI